MNVIEMNEGPKIEYEVTGNKITFDDDLTLNLAKREEDDPVEIDICSDEDGNLVIGSAAGRAYVAQIAIPAREYEDVEEEVEPAEQAAADEEDTDAEGDGEPITEAETRTVRKPVPFNIDRVTLALWAI